MGRPVVHWELWSKNPEKIGSFYSRVFDWDVRHLPEMDYRVVETGGTGGVNGGIMKPQEGPWPGNMALYIDVDDLAAYRKRVVEAGGEIVVEEMAVPGMGKFALFRDPDGRVQGLWEVAQRPG
jgi:hypothetical protein